MKRVLTCLVVLIFVSSPLALAGAQPEDRDTAGVTAAACSAEIDRLFADDWHAHGVNPAELTGDAEFLRRVTLDLTGVIPDVGEVRAFLSDLGLAK